MSQGRDAELARLRERIGGLEEEVERLAHVASVWELVVKALEGRATARSARTLSRATGVRLVGVRKPRRLRVGGKRDDD